MVFDYSCPILIFLCFFFGFRVRNLYGTDGQTDTWARRVMRPTGWTHKNDTRVKQTDNVNTQHFHTAARNQQFFTKPATFTEQTLCSCTFVGRFPGIARTMREQDGLPVRSSWTHSNYMIT